MPRKKFIFPKFSPAAWAAIGVIIAALLGSPVLIELIKDKSPNQTQNPVSRIPIQDEYYHIGDVEYVSVIQNGQVIDTIYFTHREPQSNPFTKDFVLQKVPRQAVLYLTAKSVDPDEKKSPIKIYFNGEFCDFLNRYSTNESMDEKIIAIPISPSLLQEGTNNIQIFVESTNTGLLINIDDIEFRNAYIEIIP